MKNERTFQSFSRWRCPCLEQAAAPQAVQLLPPDPHVHPPTHTQILLSHSMQGFYVCIFFFFIWKTSECCFFTHSKVSFAEIH